MMLIQTKDKSARRINIKPFNPCRLDLTRNSYPESDIYKYNSDEHSSIIVEETLQTDIISNPSHISIFPNPANDNITIELTADCHTIEIYDSFGRMMMSRQVTESLSHQVVDISKYPSGLYLVVVKDDNNRYYKRIVKN